MIETNKEFSRERRPPHTTPQKPDEVFERMKTSGTLTRIHRLHRLKRTHHLRSLMSEVDFTTSHLIQPLFAVQNLPKAEDILGLPGNFRHSLDSLFGQIEKDLTSGIRHFILFPVPSKESSHVPIDAQYRSYLNNSTYESNIIAQIKRRFGYDLCLWVDTCLCSSTHHGHCCLFDSHGNIDSQQTLLALAEKALSYAAAGADGISPSDMMDGTSLVFRECLDASGFENVPIMSYSTKFASSFYGPFRAAADSAPMFGDRKHYQLDIRSRSEAIRASVRCAQEGADLLMVKPAMTAMDLIFPIAQQTGRPVGAYQVSGEYAGLALSAQAGLIDMGAALLETWQSLRRAGSQYIITYGARLAHSLGVPK